jgi:hypothetical protein
MGDLDDFTSEIELQIDSNAGHLGSPREITEASAHATHREIGGWGTNGKVTHLEHGTYGGAPASLICFKFNYLFKDGGRRFSSSEIRVTFSKTEDDTQSNAGITPVVISLTPKLIRGQTIQAAISHEVSMGASFPSTQSLVGAGVSAGYKRVEAFSKDYSLQIKGFPWSSGKEGQEIENIAIWKVTENPKQGEGIPNELSLGVIVRHGGGTFHGTVEIKVKTWSNISLFGWPWPKPNPLVFRPSVSLGVATGVKDFAELTGEDWTKLVPFVSPGLVEDF